MSDQLRVISYGGGVQSTALLVLAARGVIDYQLALFCNVGDDSEHPATLRYVREVALPYLDSTGVTLQILKRHRRDGTPETLYGRLTKEGSRSIPIPVKMSRTGAPGTRSCTADFKIKVLSKAVKALGATKDNPAVMALGISLDEIHRARTASGEAVQRLDYPLLKLRMDRNECAALIRSEGLPVPPKSSCWFCPFHSNGAWQEMRDQEPDLFERAVALEETINARLRALNRDEVYFHNRLKPLPMATSEHRQGRLFEDSPLAACESGYCMV